MSSQIEDSKSYLKVIMVISTFGGLLFGYDTGVVNGALPYMAEPDQLNLTPLHEGMEYFCAFGLLLTLVWLYIEILRLIQMILAMFGGDD